MALLYDTKPQKSNKQKLKVRNVFVYWMYCAANNIWDSLSVNPLNTIITNLAQ